MNKQYKVIWSKVKNTYVVVSELAKRNGKSESGSSRQYVSAAGGFGGGGGVCFTDSQPYWQL